MKSMISRTCLIVAALAGGATAASGRDMPIRSPAVQWRLDRVVIVMRHGVRPPTKADPLPNAMTKDAWPRWDVGWGQLTGHGARAVGLLGDFDRARYRALLGPGCPVVRVVADIDERTVHTAMTYIDHMLPGCAIAVEHVAPGQVDPRFSPFADASPLTKDDALAAAMAALPDGGLSALDSRFYQHWRAIDTITGCTDDECSITMKPTTLAAPDGRAKLSGALGVGASFAQTLALEYADGKPLAEVGWGRATLARITRLSQLHAAEFAITARPPAIARAGARALLGEVRAALTSVSAPRLSVFVGHDSNLSWLGGTLGLHWHVPQFADDDPPPGGALLFERWSNGAGRYRLRVLFRSQTLDEMRNLTPVGHAAVTATQFAACSGRPRCDLTGLVTALGAP